MHACAQDLTLGVYDGAEHDLIAPAVAALTRLTRLALLEHSDGAGAVCQAAAAAVARAAAAHCPALASLRLALELDDPAADATDDLAALRACAALRELAVYAVDFPEEDETSRVGRALAALPPLRALHLSLLSPSYDLAALLAPQTALTALSLRTPLHHCAAIALAHAVAAAPALRALALHSCQLTAEGCAALARPLARLRHLRHLDLSANGLADDAAHAVLLAVAGGALQSLDLSGHKMSARFVHGRAAALVATLSSLSSLSLCARGRAGLSDCPAPALEALLAALPRLVGVQVAEVPDDESPVGVTRAMARQHGIDVRTF